MTRFKLNQSQVTEFINMYQERECLWNQNLAIFTDSRRKHRALQEIASHFMVSLYIFLSKQLFI